MSNSAEKKYCLYVHGMHCQSCVVLTESELNDHPQVTNAHSDLTSRTVEFTAQFGDKTPDEVATLLTPVVHKYGYTLSTTPEKPKVRWHEFIWALPAAFVLIAGFFWLQKLGIVDLVSAGSLTYGTAFTIGIVASLSTCLAVVGSLVLSLSATYAKQGASVRPQIFFHAGRIISFFVLGGVIGAIGSTWQPGLAGSMVLALGIALVMLLLGINLLDITTATQRWQPTMPTWIGKRVVHLTSLRSTITPALVGMATFFMPCGFTQSMQLFSLTTGSFWQGGLTMLFFALGTLPVLALISVSSFSIQKSKHAGVFFKTAGLIVIVFALLSMYNALAAAGYVAPLAIY